MIYCVLFVLSSSSSASEVGRVAFEATLSMCEGDAGSADGGGAALAPKPMKPPSGLRFGVGSESVSFPVPDSDVSESSNASLSRVT